MIGYNVTVVGNQNSAEPNVYVADTLYKKAIIYDSVASGTFNGKNFNMLADTFTLIGRPASKLTADQCVAVAPSPTTSTVVTTGQPTISSTTGAAATTGSNTPATTATTGSAPVTTGSTKPATTGSSPITTGSAPVTTGSVSTTGSIPATTTGSAPVTTASTKPATTTSASTTGSIPSSTTGEDASGTTKDASKVEDSSASFFGASIFLVFFCLVFLF